MNKQNQVNTVATLLMHHKDRVLGLAALYGRDNELSKCTDFINELLQTDEAKNILQQDKDRCIETLKSCEKNKNKYFSTLTTWILAIKC